MNVSTTLEVYDLNRKNHTPSRIPMPRRKILSPIPHFDEALESKTVYDSSDSDSDSDSGSESDDMEEEPEPEDRQGDVTPPMPEENDIKPDVS